MEKFRVNFVLNGKTLPVFYVEAVSAEDAKNQALKIVSPSGVGDGHVIVVGEKDNKRGSVSWNTR